MPHWIFSKISRFLFHVTMFLAKLRKVIVIVNVNVKIYNMKYFKFSELTASATAERLAIDNTPPRAAQQMLTVLVEQLLDPIRRRYGAPIIVTSGFRCPALNTAVGGVANSHHIIGCAADITAGSIEQNRVLFALIIDMQAAHAIRFTQVIAEKGYRWLHISYVPGMLRNQIIDVNKDTTTPEPQALEIAYQDSG